jgi:hypothetical protein
MRTVLPSWVKVLTKSYDQTWFLCSGRNRTHEPSAPRLLLLGNLQPFAAPDPLHPVFAHVPAGFTQLDRDAPIAVPAIAVGQCNDGPGQCVFVVPLCGLVALRAAWLINQLARMALTRSAPLCMLYIGTPTLRA